MTTKTKLELTWPGKQNRPRLEPRILLEDKALSYHEAPRTAPDLVGQAAGAAPTAFVDNLLADDIRVMTGISFRAGTFVQEDQPMARWLRWVHAFPVADPAARLWRPFRNAQQREKVMKKCVRCGIYFDEAENETAGSAHRRATFDPSAL